MDYAEMKYCFQALREWLNTATPITVNTTGNRIIHDTYRALQWLEKNIQTKEGNDAFTKSEFLDCYARLDQMWEWDGGKIEYNAARGSYNRAYTNPSATPITAADLLPKDNQ